MLTVGDWSVSCSSAGFLYFTSIITVIVHLAAGNVSGISSKFSKNVLSQTNFSRRFLLRRLILNAKFYSRRSFREVARALESFQTQNDHLLSYTEEVPWTFLYERYSDIWEMFLLLINHAFNTAKDVEKPRMAVSATIRTVMLGLIMESRPEIYDHFLNNELS